MRLNLTPAWYWIRNAMRGIRHSLGIQFAASVTIALCLLLVGAALLGLQNLKRITARWGRGVQVVVYLVPDAPRAKVADLFRKVRARPEVTAVDWVTPTEALDRLSASLGSQRDVLAGVESDFLPASLEVTLQREGRSGTLALLSMLRSSPLVEEVEYMGDWARRIGNLVMLLNLLGMGVALSVVLSCTYIVAATIRLSVHARRDEIEVQKLVGATDRFVRAPFLIEGALQGLLGACAATGLLYLGYRLGAPRLERLLDASLAGADIGFLSPESLLLGLVLGAGIGLLGSRVAVGRYIEV